MYRNRFGKICLFSSGTGPHLTHWSNTRKASRHLSILRRRISHSATTDTAIPSFSNQILAYIVSVKCFGAMVTISQVEPRRNSDKCSSSTA